MQFGQIERESWNDELWSLWQRGQSSDYLHLSMRYGHEQHEIWRSQHPISHDQQSPMVPPTHWFSNVLAWKPKR